MAISQFPPQGSSSEVAGSDFSINVIGANNNTSVLNSPLGAGSYNISFSPSDPDGQFDIYLIAEDGSSVGHTSSSNIVASTAFDTVVLLGLDENTVANFSFAGAIASTASSGTETGAGAYLSGISPTDLPNVDDTATVTGGNFASDVEIYFESGETSTEAKNVTRSDSNTLIVTRPDSLDPELDPWDVRAVNPGVTPPTGTNAHILSGVVDSGATPVWSTTSPLSSGSVGQPYSETLSASDADGQSITYTITSGSLANGLSLDPNTGVISGTPTEKQNTFEVTASDGSGGTNSRSFDIPLTVATGGTVTESGGYTYHTFNSSGTLNILAELDIEYVAVAGGGGGGSRNSVFGGAGGGGGGVITNAGSPTTASPQSMAIVVGSGGAGSALTSTSFGGQGGDSQVGNIAVADGGGYGAYASNEGGDGGAGGGSAGSTTNFNGGVGNQGGNGGSQYSDSSRGGAGGGGGGGADGQDSPGGNSSSRGGAGGSGGVFFISGGNQRVAGGGGGGSQQNNGGNLYGDGGSGGGGHGGGNSEPAEAGTNTFGGGGGGGGVRAYSNNRSGAPGGNGRVIVRYLS